MTLKRSRIQVYKRRLQSLNQRADYLIERIEQGKKEGKEYHYDKQELSAIVWAINIIEDNPEIAIATLRYEPPTIRQEGGEDV